MQGCEGPSVLFERPVRRLPCAGPRSKEWRVIRAARVRWLGGLVVLCGACGGRSPVPPAVTPAPPAAAQAAPAPAPPAPPADPVAALIASAEKHYAAGHFVVSGRKIPRDGGIILAVGRSREEIEAIVREDPFVDLGLAEFRIIEFRASQRAEDIQRRIDGF